MDFFELKASIRSRILDVMHKNAWRELDDYSLILSDRLAKRLVANKKANISKIVDQTRTNFFKANNISKAQFTKELVDELDYLYELFQSPKRKLSQKKLAKSNGEKPREDFSEEAKLATLRKQDHRCAICGRLLGVVDFDHIDGDRSNNDVSNCQAICPYCHAIKSRTKQSLDRP